VFLAIGIFFIVVGCYSLWFPFAKGASVARIIGVLDFLPGIIKAQFSVHYKYSITHLQRNAAIGIVDSLIGIFLLSYHGIAMHILPFLFSFWI